MNVKDWLGEDNKFGLDIFEEKYRRNGESFEEWLDRVSGGNEQVRQLILEKKFLFAGRVLANRGIPDSGNYYNCFSRGYIPDDYTAIMDTLKEIGITFKHQGGQGVSLSKLRPKGTPIGEEYESDGIMPFLEMLDTVTRGTSQGGARKGALIVSCDIRHKEAIDFITVKTDLNKINTANLSLEIDDEFMAAVNEYYCTGAEIVFHEVREYSGHKIEYDICPIKLYKKIMETVWDNGEPGVIFTDRFRNYNFMECDDRYQIETCNPCGEQPLKQRSCCNLGSINLYEFVDNKFTNEAKVNWKELAIAIHIACEALDEIIDENAERIPDELAEYRENALNWRNIGLGVFGYAYMLMALKLTYGSKEAITFTNDLFDYIMKIAIVSNKKRGNEKGSFPNCDINLINQSMIMKLHDKDNEYDIDAFRNCSLLSIAPTGTISNLLLNGSGGIEPEFALSYTRRTDNLKESYQIESKIVRDYRTATGNTGKLPEYFVCAADIDWEDRVDTQAVIQKHIDTAISSTVNVPKEATVEDIEQLYLYAWTQGIKGITIFRDGCKRQSILTTQIEDGSTQEIHSKTPSDLPRGYVLDAAEKGIGLNDVIHSGCGKIYLNVKFDPSDGQPYEIFINKGSQGSCRCNLEGITRASSYALRCGGCVEGLIDQLNSVDACGSYVTRTATHGDTSKGKNCPSAIAYKIKELCEEYNEIFGPADDDTGESQKINAHSDDGGMSCPKCGEKLTMEGGCIQCNACGWSKCD